MKYIPAIFFLFLFIQTYSQDKVEKEYRIQPSEAPEKAVSFINETYPDATKVKWYLEESEDRKSYEAKLKWDNNKHSVEFDLQGAIEDIEITAKPINIHKEVLKELESELAGSFDKFKIRKIQIQYSGSEEQLSRAIRFLDYKQVLKKYEIVIEGKKDRNIDLWECLFDADGKLLSKRRIIEKPTNNLDF